MTKSKNIFVLLNLVLVLMMGCTKDKETVSAIDYRYYPIAVGDSMIYQVSLFNKDLNTYDSTYQLLERVESVFNDNEGRPTFRLERYVRKSDADAWSIYKVWTSNKTSTSIEKQEDNITYIKLIFPVKLNKTWNGNAKNIFADDFEDYKIISLNEPLQSGNYSFDSTLNVRQIDYDYGFEKRKHFEIYASGVGMIYKDEYDSLQGSPLGKIYHYTETLLYHNKK
ncbi:MAG TPA: hypothetical protein PLJ79_03545 [Bacteroidia bacterium]|nr:hypothetical protein [Bacteroidia bacterium]